jgi:hypothetical protein
VYFIFTLILMVGSTGCCNTGFKFIRWRVKRQGLPGTLIPGNFFAFKQRKL